MKPIIKTLIIIMSMALLSACSSWDWGRDYDEHYTHHESNYHERFNPDRPRYHGRRSHYRQRVHVPDSYHFARGSNPTKHKHRDKNWVQSQDPNSYTIEVAKGEKRSEVAKRLSKAPKGNRQAQVKGSDGYRGVYGTYKTREDAQRALHALPENVRGSANVKSWDKVQSDLD